MSARTYYVEAFSTITVSQIGNLSQRSVSAADFNSVKKGADIGILFTNKQMNNFSNSERISEDITDISKGNIFGFVDKNGKKGLIMIDDYQRNVPTGSEASLTLHIKVER